MYKDNDVTVEDRCGNEDSLEKLIEKGDILAADRLLSRMLADMTESDDGRFAE